MKIDIKLRILEKPGRIDNCIDQYTIPRAGPALYQVCIADNIYIVYDHILTDSKYVEDILKLEEELYDTIVGETPLAEKISKINDPRLRHIVERQFTGYGVLEPFLMDPDVVNVHVMSNKPIQIIHRVYDRLQTSIVPTIEEVEELAMRLASSAGKPLSEALPLVSFIEPRYEARVTVVYRSDVTMRRNITVDVRKLPENPWTLLKLINLGSLSIEEAAFLWLMVKYRVPIVIVGELLTGKTTLATALLALVPPGSRVMTAEDTPEFRIPVTYWTRTTTREFGEYKVTYFDLLKTGVRLSLDYIIVGEIRGEEAREWAHSILLGHGAITTFHAESPESALLRLISPPISVDPQVIKFLNVFVKTNVVEREVGKRVYRHEVYIIEENRSIPLFIYDPESDKIIRNPEIENPIIAFKFIDRIILAHKVTRPRLYREYKAMEEVIKETYREAHQIDPTLNIPTFSEIPKILYEKLESKLGASAR
ncbi:MAG: type II/IV secretion system ATPase subunit [Desulfurococcaceae archaeon]